MATLVERVKKLVDRELTVLESWTEGPDTSLTDAQLKRLDVLARLARQLDLDGIESETVQSLPLDVGDLLKAAGYGGDETPQE